MRFLADGRLPLHDNASELSLRRQVLGRCRDGRRGRPQGGGHSTQECWLFCGSDDRAEVDTLSVSLVAVCRAHQIEPATGAAPRAPP